MLEVVESPDPPVRLALGPDSVARILGKLESVGAELEEWRELSLSTDLADAEIARPDRGRGDHGVAEITR